MLILFLLSGASLESPSRNVDSPMDLVGQCLFPVWAHQCHIVSKNLLIVNEPIKSRINVSSGDNDSGGKWSHFPPSSAGYGFKDCNDIHGSGEKGSHLLPHSVLQLGPIMSQSCWRKPETMTATA